MAGRSKPAGARRAVRAIVRGLDNARIAEQFLRQGRRRLVRRVVSSELVKRGRVRLGSRGTSRREQSAKGGELVVVEGGLTREGAREMPLSGLEAAGAEGGRQPIRTGGGMGFGHEGPRAKIIDTGHGLRVLPLGRRPDPSGLVPR
jgi:hypothetical protein